MAAQDGIIREKVGVYYKEHPTRKRDSINKDRQWQIRQRLGGKLYVSILGWERLDGISAGDASNKADFYKSNHKFNAKNPESPRKPVCIKEETMLRQESAGEMPTVNAIAEKFLKHMAKEKKAASTIKEYTRQLNKYILPILGKKRAIDVTDTAIINIIEPLSDTAPIMSNRVLATIKSMFSYAVKFRKLKVNPAAGIQKMAAEVVKERYLEQKEVIAMFKALDEYGNRDTADIMKIITLTGCRPGEIREMRIAQLQKDTSGSWLKLATSDTKGKRSRRAYINKLAYQIIKDRISDLDLTSYIFPASRGCLFMRDDVLNNRIHDVLETLSKADIEPFTAHDLRRTTATNCATLGFGAIVPDILGHAPQGVTRRHYDKYSREPEIKRALDTWGKAIERGLQGTCNIVPLVNQQG